MAYSYVLLDNSALNRLYGGQLHKDFPQEQVERLRERLERAADEDRLRVFMNMALLEEVAGCWHNPARRARFGLLFGGLRRLAMNRFLRLPVPIKELPGDPGRQANEAHFRRPLREDERFIEPDRIGAMLDNIGRHQANVVVEAGNKAYRIKQGYPAEELARRMEVLSQVQGADGQEYLSKWAQGTVDYRHAVIDDWTQTTLQERFAEWGLPSTPHLWPAPREFRSAWFERAYCVARLMEFLPTGEVDGGDIYDAAYFWDASYADVLVTTDEGLLRRAATIQAPGLRTVRFHEWAGEWLVG